jgi:tyrosinase
MDISRRHLMIQGAAFAAAAGGASLIDEASAQAAPVERRSLADLPLNDPVMEALREGVRRLKALPANNPVRWASLAAIHGTDAGPGRCPHGNWYFLPWHRAYILMYERIIRDVTSYQQFAMPYWDWTANRRLPEAFAPATVGGRPNPLYQPARRITPTESLREENVGPTVMSQILATAAFEQFGSSRPEGQSSTTPEWVLRQGVSGELESNPHNRVHTTVGGVLATLASPLDPVFLMHHCNIDRIWAAWRAAGHQDTTEPFWLDMHFESNFYNPDGTPYSPRVSEMLDPAQLGYSYGTSTPTAHVLSPSVSAMASLITQVLAGRQVGPGIRTFRTTSAQSAAAPAPVQAPVTVDTTLLGQVVRRPPLPSAESVAGIDLRQELAARGTRALAILRNMDPGDSQDLQYRVFVDCDYLSASTPITDAHYVGTFGFFGNQGGHAGHGAGGPSVVLDLTEALGRVHGSLPSVPGSIRVQVLPVTRTGAAPAAADSGASRIGAPVAELRIERVEVAFVST